MTQCRRLQVDVDQAQCVTDDTADGALSEYTHCNQIRYRETRPHRPKMVLTPADYKGIIDSKVNAATDEEVCAAIDKYIEAHADTDGSGKILVADMGINVRMSGIGKKVTAPRLRQILVQYYSSSWTITDGRTAGSTYLNLPEH